MKGLKEGCLLGETKPAKGYAFCQAAAKRHLNNIAQPKTDKWFNFLLHFFVVFDRLAVV